MTTNKIPEHIDAQSEGGSSNNFVMNILRAADPERDTMLPKILHVSLAIFGEDVSSGHYGSYDEWLRRLSLPGALIVYISRIRDDTSEQVDSDIIAFVFVHPRSHDESPLQTRITKSAHIWIAGVLPNARKQGLLAKMMDMVEAEVRKDVPNQMGFGCGEDRVEDVMLTVCTTPSKFPVMWGWLQARHWNVEREMKGKIMLSKPLKKTSNRII